MAEPADASSPPPLPDARAAEAPTGPAIAAVLAALVGTLAFSAAFLAAEFNEGFKNAMQALGSWMPQAKAIGPLSGKFTFMLLAWLGSWAVLHPGLKNRRPDLQAWFYLFLLGALAAFLLLWPPLIVRRFHG